MFVSINDYILQTCFRLFSEKQYATFEAYPTPEIFRVPLETILLQMISMGLPNVRSFPFIESPEEECIEQAIWSLKQHVSFINFTLINFRQCISVF